MSENTKKNDPNTDNVFNLPDEVATEATVGGDEAGDSSMNASSDSIAKLQAENTELRKQYLYLRADFDNYRKQMLKERSDLVKFGSEPILREFLNILDDLERAANSELKPETMESFKNGVTLIVNQFKKVFDRFGVEEVESHGKVFDPQIHEALGSLDSPEFPPNSVTQVYKKAYKLHGKVIRPAQVMVNSSKGE